MTKKEIKDDLNKAVKEKNSAACGVLRMVLAAISNKEKEKKYKEKKEVELTDEEILSILTSEAKKRKEAILEFKKADREELVQKEKIELDILQKYLPQQLSGEELENMVREAIGEVKAESMKDMGRVMARIMPKIKGRADGSEISRIAKEILS